jgi:hypothetical protein
MTTSRGQALVEMALMLPILLTILIGGMSLGLAIADRIELRHAAIEGVDAGADLGRPARCARAIDIERHILGRRPATETCRPGGQYLELTLGEPFALPIPFVPGDFRVSVTERARTR